MRPCAARPSPATGPSLGKEKFRMKRRKQSPASAVIEASLQIAQEYARIIEAASINHQDNYDQTTTDGQLITNDTQSVVTK
jgi:hypothetical protein